MKNDKFRSPSKNVIRQKLFIQHVSAKKHENIPTK